MKEFSSQEYLKSRVKTAELHSKRLTSAINRVNKIKPITTADLEIITDENLGYLEMLSSRFGKLQDELGAKIFPTLLDLLKEEDKSMIDKLNKLEKLQYVPSTDWWLALRDLRNELSHDYPDDSEKIIARIAELIEKSQELLSFWNEFKAKIEKHTC